MFISHIHMHLSEEHMGVIDCLSTKMRVLQVTNFWQEKNKQRKEKEKGTG